MMIPSIHFLLSVLTISTFISVMSIPLQALASTNETSFEEISNESADISKLNVTAPVTQGSKLNVIATFYPIFEFVKQVGGDKVAVTSLIPVGVEPHDFEPTIQQIQNAEVADLVIYNGAGLEGPWLQRINTKNILDTSQGLNITTSSADTDEHEDNENETSQEAEESHSVSDPHIWLDPILAKEQAMKIRDSLIRIDPQNAAYYDNNTALFLAELDNLDAEIRASLSDCNKKDFIAFHDAFSYFSNRYDLNQHSITNALAPEGEVLPQRLQEVIQLAMDLGITTIFSEDLIDPRSAEVIAQELPNGNVLTLSPIEGINSEEQAAGIGYLDKMKENIANLKIGLEC